MITGKPEHLKAFDYLGPYRYFLTFCTYQRREVFLTRERADVVHEQFMRAGADEGFEILAYCFMPDHVHLLAGGQASDSDCRRFIARAKQLSGFHFQKMFGQRLWQRYGFERTLRSEESTLAVARYILENPVRAGLVERVEDYAFLGSCVHSIDEILTAVEWRSG
jgi:putative transposase